jgi:hypothetical protein
VVWGTAMRGELITDRAPGRPPEYEVVLRMSPEEAAIIAHFHGCLLVEPNIEPFDAVNVAAQKFREVSSDFWQKVRVADTPYGEAAEPIREAYGRFPMFKTTAFFFPDEAKAKLRAKHRDKGERWI